MFFMILRVYGIVINSSTARLHNVNTVSMPNNSTKKLHSKQKTKDKEESVSGVDQVTGPVSPSTDGSGSVLLKVVAKPGSQRNSITDISEEGVGVQIAAPPSDGEANAELIKYLAKVMGLRKSDVSIHKGAKSRNKTILVCGGLTVDDITNKLKVGQDS